MCVGGFKMSNKPRYWDSWRGQILRAIIIDKAITWLDVREKSGLEQKKMFKVVGELKRANELDYSKETGFKVLDDTLIQSYERMTDQNVPEPKTTAPSSQHIEWLQGWIDSNEGCDATLEHHHFFLDGPNLFELTRKLIERAKKSIYIINPYVDKASLGTALRTAAKSGVDILLITRRPIDNRLRWDFHKTLIQENVDLYYSGDENVSGGVHSKLLIVDDEIVIVSSMNFTSHSESYNYETGIVSIDKATIESAKEALISIRDEPETKSAAGLHR